MVQGQVRIDANLKKFFKVDRTWKQTRDLFYRDQCYVLFPQF
jgi:hypothetical protein